MTENAAPVIPLAATVLLLRQGLGGPEVLMMTRHAASVFAAGALVFPGGRVDPSDADPAIQALCRPVPDAGGAEMALRLTAIRETYEEVHLLLARRRGEEMLLSAVALAALEKRLETSLGRVPGFLDLLADGEVEPATDLLVPFAHWITPALRPIRYDTIFYLAPAPADQQATADGQEAIDALWLSPQHAVDEGDAGRFSLIFVTRFNLLKLGRSATIDAALDAARADTIITVCPEYIETPAGGVFRIPAAAGYGIAEFPAGKTKIA